MEAYPLPESNSENLDQDMNRHTRWGQVEGADCLETTGDDTGRRTRKRRNGARCYRAFKRFEDERRIPLRMVEFKKFGAGIATALVAGCILVRLVGVEGAGGHLFMAGRGLYEQRLGTEHAPAIVLVEHDARGCQEHKGCQKSMSDPLQQVLFFAKIMENFIFCKNNGKIITMATIFYLSSP